VYVEITLLYFLLNNKLSDFRLLRYDPVKNTTEVLLENLRFANGIQLSRYEDFILVCETFAARILK